MKQIPLKTGPRKSFFLFKARPSKGLSLMEIIVATLIFALVIAGLINLFIAAKRLTLHARSRIQASEVGKQFLDPLQMQVREDLWGANCLGTGVCAPGAWVQYNANTTVAPVAGTTLRRVDVTINWNEN
jgi:Tfp pilus assembly protein PilW